MEKKLWRLDGELPPSEMTEEQYDEWLKKNGVKKTTKEEKAKALEEYYKKFPNERPKENK